MHSGPSHRLSEPQGMLRDTVRRFVRKELWLHEKRLDPNATRLPTDAFDDLAAKVQAMGLADLLVPDAAHGPELDAVTRALLAEETSQHRAGVLHASYELFGVDVPPQLLAADDAQRQTYLEPLLQRDQRCFVSLDDPTDAAQPPDGVRPRARWMGEEWMLDGTKIFVAGAEHADFGIVLARTEDQHGQAQGLSCFVVDAHRVGFQRWRPYPTIALGRDTMELNFSNLRLPPQNLLGQVGAGATFAAQPLAFRRIIVAAQLTGVASAAQDMARQQAASRREFGAALGTQQGVAWALADNEADVRSARSLYLAAAEECDRDEDFAPSAALARLLAAEAAGRVVDRTIQIHGPAALSADLPLERWYRELRLRRLDDGAAGAQRSAVAAQLLNTFKK